MAQSNLTALKREMNKAIEDGNFDRADDLAKELCRLQGFEDTQAMPENFCPELKRKAGKDMKKVNKNLIKAAVAMLVLGASAATVSAGVYHHIRESEHIDAGIVAYTSDSFGNVDVSSDGVSVSDDASKLGDSSEIDYDATKLPKEGGGTVSKVVGSEKGAEGDVWLIKTTEEEVDKDHFSSDDGVDWKREPQYYRYTKCTFNDFEAACKELDIVNIFDKAYALKGDGTYTHQEYKENKKDEYMPSSDSLGATFSYHRGYFDLSQSWYRDEDKTAEEERTFMVITGEDTTNKREYDSKNNLHFALSDSEQDGKIATTTVLSFDEYDVTIQFFDLSEKEIHEILDSIVVK